MIGATALAALTGGIGAGSATAAPASPSPTSPTSPSSTSSSSSTADWPTEIALPNGFLPEGIAIGAGPYAYFGSRADGAVYRADLRTGTGSVVYAGETGTTTNGLKVDHDGLLYLSSGSTGGAARVVDSGTGRLVAHHQLTDPSGHFINDIALLGDHAWFTDSYDAVLYGVPRGGTGDIRELPIGGDWVQPANGIGANGLVGTPDRTALIVVNGGKLYRVPLATGEAVEITLSGVDALTYGDGLLRIGRTLYVVQNRLNQVSVLDLDAAIGTAVLKRTVTDPRYDVPTTAALHRDRLYVVNARLTTPPAPDTTFSAIGVPL
ncbi:SMP-30/gluconolactonase/LRE family protein [Streptomyces sp. NPDC059477]|uniref:SMP-30/gluconolactonase/LRE family protein n=1 Tax=Streptomyces sp. NPDC059477 TaxID=3346847 RepID=UPI0036A9C7ED